METIPVEIRTTEIRLDGVLKFAGVVGTGGEGKMLIRAGQVRVNGRPETRRGRRLHPGDRVEILDEEQQVQIVLELRTATQPPS